MRRRQEDFKHAGGPFVQVVTLQKKRTSCSSGSLPTHPRPVAGVPMANALPQVMSFRLNRRDQEVTAWTSRSLPHKSNNMEKLIRYPEDGQLGVFVPLDHPDVVRCRPQSYLYKRVAQRIEQDRSSIDAWIREAALYFRAAEWGEVPDNAQDETTPYWMNGFFSGADARALVAMLRIYQPRRYVEIGSGNSTKFARWAIKKWSLRTRITSIDSAPRAVIRHVADEVIEKSLLDVSPEFFDSLDAGDVLFHDGSHLVFNGTDTVALFLEVLPRIKPGVIFHIHDISLPWEYISAFDNRGYNEQYMLASLLLFSSSWEVLAPLTYLHHRNELDVGGTSFWMRRI